MEKGKLHYISYLIRLTVNCIRRRQSLGGLCMPCGELLCKWNRFRVCVCVSFVPWKSPKSVEVCVGKSSMVDFPAKKKCQGLKLCVFSFLGHHTRKKSKSPTAMPGPSGFHCHVGFGYGSTRSLGTSKFGLLKHAIFKSNFDPQHLCGFLFSCYEFQIWCSGLQSNVFSRFGNITPSTMKI